MFAGILAVICNVGIPPSARHQTPQHIELAAGRCTFCNSTMQLKLYLRDMSNESSCQRCEQWCTVTQQDVKVLSQGSMTKDCPAVHIAAADWTLNLAIPALMLKCKLVIGKCDQGRDVSGYF